ncbi:MAG TPA: hypothetical protein VJ761_09670 [Ktedonobacteraceae bacterium]|nr:hypothetical protein [Ktedonobacteraceae bacterium]
MPNGSKKPLIARSVIIYIVGIIVSLGLAVLPVLIGQSESINLLIAVVGIAATSLLSFALEIKESETKILDMVRLSEEKVLARVGQSETTVLDTVKEEEKEIVEVVTLGEELAEDQELCKFIKDIVAECKGVKQMSAGIDIIFLPRMKAALKQCLDDIEELADGEEDIFDESSFRRSGIRDTKSSIQLVQLEDPSYLLGQYGRNYLSAQEEARKRGVEITRIWLQDKEVLLNTEIRRIITQQAKLGIKTRIAEKSSVPHRFHKDYGVIDKRIYVTPITRMVNQWEERGEHFSIDPDKVNKALDDFRTLYDEYAEEAADYYSRIDGQLFNKGAPIV